MFRNFKPSKNILRDNNWGIYALCNILNNEKERKII